MLLENFELYEVLLDGVPTGRKVNSRDIQLKESKDGLPLTYEDLRNLAYSYGGCILNNGVNFADFNYEDNYPYIAIIHNEDDEEEELSLYMDEIHEYEEEGRLVDYNEPEIFQYYIITSGFADILRDLNEIVLYNESMDLYYWGVTHWGTGWDYVNTGYTLKKIN